MIDPHSYGIEVRRRNLDGDVMFEARVRELPDIAEYADSYQEAYELAVDAVETTARLLGERGRSMPQPMGPADDWSGRVTLRLPKSLHRALAGAAEDEGCSLNQHIVNVLNYFSGYAQGERQADMHWQTSMEPEVAQAASHLRLVHSAEYPDAPTYATG